MSYIQCVLIKNGIFMSSDGRVTDGERIIDENYKKIRRINNDLLIGYSGDKVFCEGILNILQQSINCNMDVSSIYESVVIISKSLINQIGMKRGQFIIAGKYSDGKLGFITLSTNNGFSSTQKIANNSNDIYFTEAFSDNIDSDYLKTEIEKIMKEKQNSISYLDLIEAMKNAAKKVAIDDTSVNTKFYFEMIKA